MKPLVISFYTKNTPYEQEVQKLIASCQKFNIEHDIEGIESKGSWEKNCALKPSFILRKLEQHQRPIFWVDADAAFLQAPTFEEFSACDFSVRVNEFLPKDHPSYIVTNALFVRPSQGSLIQAWDHQCQTQLAATQRTEECWDQVALRDVLKSDFLPMPLKYSKIFDFDDLFISLEEVVAEHYQASRRLKRLIHAHCCH